MAVIKTIFKGESLSMLFTFPVAYDMARIEKHEVYIGETAFTGTVSGNAIVLKLKSEDTGAMSGQYKVSLWIDDATLGVRKPYVGDIVFSNTNATPHNTSTSNISDIIVPIVISETAVTVGDILYNILKGDKGDPFLYSDFTPAQITELQQPATDAIASIQAVELSVEQAEALRVQAEIDRQSNTGTAIQNAETATENANTAKDLALEVANHPDIIQNDYWYKWNTTTDVYENTNIKAKGEAGAVAVVKQTTGTSETDVMSQKAVGDELSAIAEDLGYALLDEEIIPNKSNALFHLDGSVKLIGSDYYFVDKTGNGRNFLITGYDFSEYWVKGFPYKSASTMSAPVADAALIASDVNNFLYATDETPNQIPVISLFQNVDYENKLFCRHKSAIHGENGNEIEEGCVLDICLYSSIKTGISLQIAKIYFGHTDYSSTGKWVDFANGNDTTGNGSLITPWKTINKAITSVTDGSIIYVKSVANDIGHPSLFYIYDANNNFLQFVGRCVSKATSTGFGFRFSGLNPQGISRVILEPASVTSIAFGLDANPSANITDNYCNVGVLNPDYFSLIKFTNFLRNVLKGTVKAGFTLRHSNNANFNENYIDLICAGDFINIEYNNILNIKNNKIKGTHAGNQVINKIGTGALNFVGNKLTEITYQNQLIYCDKNGSSVLIGYNKIINPNASGKYAIDILNMLSHTLSIIGNVFTGMSGDAGNSIQTRDCNIIITGNMIDNRNTTNISGADIQNVPTSASTKTFLITGNKVISNRTGGYYIAVNIDSGNTFYNSMIGSIKGNYIKGSGYFNKLNYGTTHGMFIRDQKDSEMTHNLIIGASYGVLFKGSGVNTKGAYYNILVDCYQPIYNKGYDGLTIVNNTIVNTLYSGIPNYGILLGVNTVGTEPKNCVVKNNIIVSLLPGDYTAISISNVTNDIDYNLYYCPNGNLKFSYLGNLKTFSEWQTLGYDTNSKVLTDKEFETLFSDFSNGDYSLKNGSIAIGFGDALLYDDGLDSLTDWGGDDSTPLIVLKKQAANWDVGAYIH